MSDKVTLFDRFTIPKWAAWVGGGLFALITLFIAFTALMRPLIGSSYSEAISPLYVDDGYGYGFGGGAGYALEAPAAEEAAFYAADASYVVAETSANTASPVRITERLIIRTGYISTQVDDTRDARAEIEALVDSLTSGGAFVVSAYEYEGGNGPNISMAIRVPAEQFDNVLNHIADMAEVVNERNETANDVTEEYVDLQGRIEALQTARERLLEIMQNADTTEALLQAEAQLTQREAEIESIQGRIQYLAQSASLSLINIELRPYIVSQPIDRSWRPLETVREAFDDLLNNLEDFVDNVIYFVIVGIPVLLIWGLILYGVWRLIRWFWGLTFGRKPKEKNAEAVKEEKPKAAKKK